MQHTAAAQAIIDRPEIAEKLAVARIFFSSLARPAITAMRHANDRSRARGRSQKKKCARPLERRDATSEKCKLQQKSIRIGAAMI
jgi:hypothetical protein